MPNSYKLTTPFLFKTIRTGKDEEDCWGDFVAGLLGSKKPLRVDRKPFTIRLGHPGADAKRRYEIVQNKRKIPLFALAMGSDLAFCA